MQYSIEYKMQNLAALICRSLIRVAFILLTQLGMHTFMLDTYTFIISAEESFQSIERLQNMVYEAMQ